MKNKISLLSLVIMGSLVGGSSVMGLDNTQKSASSLPVTPTLTDDLTKIDYQASASK